MIERRLAMVVLLWCGCGDDAHTAPVRPPVVSVEIGIDPPRCDGSFEGRLTLAAAWPAGNGNRAGAATTVRQRRAEGLAISTMDTADFESPASGPDPKRETRQIQGTLTDPCRPGTLEVATQSHTSGLRPPRPDPTANDTETVRALGFKLLDIEQLYPANAQRRLKLKLSCCVAPDAAAAGNYTVSWDNSTNIQGLPAAGPLVCAGPDVPIDVTGNKPDITIPARINLNITDPAGNRCVLPFLYE